MSAINMFHTDLKKKRTWLKTQIVFFNSLIGMQLNINGNQGGESIFFSIIDHIAYLNIL